MALQSATTLTCSGGSELVATPVVPGVAFKVVLGFEVDVAVGVALAVGVARVADGLADGAATAPATILNRGVDGKPEPREEQIRTWA